VAVFYGFTGYWKEPAEAVQGDLRKVGIDFQLQLFDATPVPNRVNWKDAETDALLAKGASALDPKERFDAYAKVQSKVEDAAVWIPLYHEPLHLVTGAKLKPLKAHGIYGAGLYKGLSLEMK